MQITEKKICIIIVSHTTDVSSNSKELNFDIIGSKEHRIRAHTIIGLQSRQQIKNKKSIQSSISDIIEKEGLTVGIHFNVCKAAPILTNKYIYGYLPLYSSKWTTCGGDLLNLKSSAYSKTESFDNNLNINSILGKNEIKILKLFSNKNEIKNKDVQECLNVKESSARNYLNNLCKKEILIKYGENNKAVYRNKEVNILSNVN